MQFDEVPTPEQKYIIALRTDQNLRMPMSSTRFQVQPIAVPAENLIPDDELVTVWQYSGDGRRVFDSATACYSVAVQAVRAARSGESESSATGSAWAQVRGARATAKHIDR